MKNTVYLPYGELVFGLRVRRKAGDPMNLLRVMPAKGNMKEIVGQAFDRSVNQVGFVHPEIVTQEIAAHSPQLPHVIRDRIREVVRFYPTSDFVYPDVFEFIPKALQSQSNRVDIWTDDYLDRIASSGIGELRRVLSYEQRKRFGVLSDRHDKLGVLKEVFEAQDSPYSRIVVIDDKEENLHRAHDIAKQYDADNKCEFIFLNRRKTIPLNGFVHASAFVDYPIEQNSSQTRFLIDFNGVCIDDVLYKEVRQARVVDEIEVFSSAIQESE